MVIKGHSTFPNLQYWGITIRYNRIYIIYHDRTKQICLWMTIEIYILPYPRGVEFSGEEVIVLPLASIASLFVVELRSRLPLNGCM